MKANELRIGNLLQDKVSKTELIITDLGKEFIQTYVIDRSKYPLPNGWKTEPIPLTEEWLLKFPKWFQELISGGYMNFSKLPKEYVEVKFVHTAQNLFFALTNEELTLQS